MELRALRLDQITMSGKDRQSGEEVHRLSLGHPSIQMRRNQRGTRGGHRGGRGTRQCVVHQAKTERDAGASSLPKTSHRSK